MTLTDGLTILAIVIGPIAAVLVTRWVDHRREAHNRRLDIFRTLMRTRRNPVAPEHVGALNMIEFAFDKEPTVMQAWRRLFDHFGTAHPRRDDEVILPDMSQTDQSERLGRFDERLGNERQRLLTRLLHTMATALNFPAEQLEIFEGGYTPQGWTDADAEQMLIRRFFVQMGLGMAKLPIAVFDYTQGQTEAEQEQLTDNRQKKKKKK